MEYICFLGAFVDRFFGAPSGWLAGEVADGASVDCPRFHRAEAVNVAHRGSIITSCDVLYIMLPMAKFYYNGNNYIFDSFKQLYPIGRLYNSPLAQLAIEKE